MNNHSNHLIVMMWVLLALLVLLTYTVVPKAPLRIIDRSTVVEKQVARPNPSVATTTFTVE